MKSIIVLVLCLALIIGGLVLVVKLDYEVKKDLCTNLSTQIGYPTVYFKQVGCLIEFREGWWVAEGDVINYIQFLDCLQLIKIKFFTSQSKIISLIKLLRI